METNPNECQLSSSIISSDVVVVGAGPAGSMAAKTLAEHGVRVILLEEHKQPGLPVFCGEVVSVSTLKVAGLEAKPPVVNLYSTRWKIYTPNRRHLVISNAISEYYNINRHIFDAKLCESAVKVGAILNVSTRAHSVLRENGVVTGVEAFTYVAEENKYIPVRYSAKIVIGADGHASTIRRKAFNTPYFNNFGSCAQYTLVGLDIEDPTSVEVWIGRKYAPGGYVWVFPKSKTVANVGIGVNPKMSSKPAIQYLKDFIETRADFVDSIIVNKTGGILPTTGTLPDIVDDGVMLVGDAAGQLIPMTGAGVETAIYAGKTAGLVAVKAVSTNDVSKQRLLEYPNLFNERWGKIISDSKKGLILYESLTDKELNKLSEIITPNQAQAIANGDNLLKNLLSLSIKAPRFALKILLRTL